MKWPKICKAKELEPAFIGIINKDKKNCIVDCIYEHPKMLMNEFSDMLTLILERIFLENKETCNGRLQHPPYELWDR